MELLLYAQLQTFGPYARVLRNCICRHLLSLQELVALKESDLALRTRDLGCQV